MMVNPETGCWEWQGAMYPNGYGALKVDGKVIGAHRVSYEAFTCDIPQGMFVLHSCDNRRCCNPAHLSVGTHSDNMRDMHAKNRGRPPKDVPVEAMAALRNESLSHAECAAVLGVHRDMARGWRKRIGIDRKKFAGPVEAWKRRRPAIFIDNATGNVVDENWWPDTTNTGHPPT